MNVHFAVKNKFGIFVGKDGKKAFQCWSSECAKAGDIIKFKQKTIARGNKE